jgi:2-polyprenyl-3-methyl-5-hydroxy-6-metoxy-1,4-benzoquinol methylase
MRSFAQRSSELEEMEAPDIAESDLTACLNDLARANTLTMARPPTLRWLAQATRQLPHGSSFSLLDVGYGQGDMLRAIRRWAVKRGLKPRLTGIDLSPWSATAAAAATDPSWQISYLVGDVFDYAPEEPIDFVASSLVAHHMSDHQLVRFMQWMEQNARRGWFINDLHRHPVAYYGFTVLSAATLLHRMVRHDGLISVTRAFTRADWVGLLAAAKIAPQRVAVEWRFPFRICVGRVR